MDTSAANRRIAKNTMFLYFRMLLSMGVTLYTSRVVLETLGVEDFGIYNVVGGFVSMLSFLNGTMAAATQRFLSFEIGNGDCINLNKVFMTSLQIHILIVVLVFLLAETIGLWFLNAYMNIPSDRISAANWVYQASIFSMMVTIISVPYNAVIIANERMKAFAYISILEITLKLLVAFFLVCIDDDKLKIYSILLLGVSIIIRLVYGIYCRNSFVECHLKMGFDKKKFRQMLDFSGWNLIGSLAVIGRDEGENVLLNIFYGPVVNAARGIACQISNAINMFVGNFQIALNPQIIKRYASSDYENMFSLIFKGSRYSFYLLLILILPVLLETEYILKLWLKNIPDYSILFTRLVLIFSLFDTLYKTILVGHLATGNIRLLQLIVGGLNLSILPLLLILLNLGYGPEMVFIINILYSLIGLIIRLFLFKLVIPLFSILDFCKKVLFNVLCVGIISGFFSIILYKYIQLSSDFIEFISVSFFCVFSSVISIYLIGLTSDERFFLKNKLEERYRRIR